MSAGSVFSIEVDDSKFIQQLRKAGERGKRELDGTTTAADRLEDQLRQVGATGDRAMRGLVGQTDRVGDTMERANRNAALLRNTVSTLLFTVGVISRIQTVADFSQSISTLQAVSGAAGEELEQLREKALQLGADTRFSATQAADAMGELARAGFSAKEVLASIGPTLSAAQAGGAEIATTAEIIGTTIRGFGLEAGEAARVADVLAQASNSSNAGIVDLGEALKFAAPTAKALGLELEETVAVIGKLSDGGLKGGLGGRGFQSISTQLVNNRSQVEALIGSFDIAEEGLGGVVKRLDEAGIKTEQIIKIFRAENLDTFEVLRTSAVEGSLATLEGALDNATGSTAKAAAIMDDNLNGAIQNVSSKIEALVIAIGDAGASSGLLLALEGLSKLLVVAADNADVLQAISISLAVKAIIPLAIALGTRAVTAVRALQAQLLILNAIAGRTTTGLTGVAGAGAVALRVLNPMTLAVTAAAAAYVFLARDAEKAKDRLDRATAAIENSRQALADTQDLVTGGDSPFSEISDQATGAATEVSALAGVVDQLTDGLRNLREEGQVATVLKLSVDIDQAQSAIDELEAQRNAAADRANRREVKSGVLLDAGAVDRFDRSDEGQKLLLLKQQRAALENRRRAAAKGLTISDVVDQFRNGSDASATSLPPVTPSDVAADPSGAVDGLAQAREKLFAELDAEYAVETPTEALDNWRQRQIEAIDLVARTAEERADAMAKLEAVYREKSDQLFIDQETGEASANATINRENAKAEAIKRTLAERDTEIELQIATARGDDAAVERLKAQADLRERISELISGGLDATEAQARAEAEINRLKAGELSEAQQARKTFVDGLSGDLASALSNAVRSGDYGAVFQEVINSSAARGLEDAINELAEEFANFAGNLLFGQNGAGGILGGLLGSGGTPPILDPATAGAATDAVKGAAEATAAASVTTLGAAAAGGAASVTALSVAETAGAASATALATALAAASLAAQAAASALAAVATSQGGSLATDILGGLTFGGGRARGGPVMPGKFYEVNEGGLPELLSMGSRKFLLPGSSGDVTPLANSRLPEPSSREVSRFDIYVNGTGNSEIQRAVDQGVQRAVRIAKAQAGPAAAEFQTRKV